MGAHNRAVVEQRFAWSRVGDRLEELYAEAIRAGSARGALSAPAEVVGQHLAADEPEDHAVAAVELVAGGERHQQVDEHGEQEQPQVLARARATRAPFQAAASTYPSAATTSRKPIGPTWYMSAR